ncbi:sphingolipid homeostasis protein orm1 [Blastocladiella emersonii ATCC 22665]|nr:sphingolipid homeostasis protein orm1 [Blastocladiella emersonii ATCC 22665]
MPRTTMHQRHSSYAERRRNQLVKESDASAQANFNSDWVNYKGAWATNVFIILALRVLFGIVPAISSELAWTLTNISFNIVSFFMFHMIIGTPFDFNQGACDGLTLWEQIDNEVQFTPAKKFFTALPIGLFLISTHYTHYDATNFCVNLIVLAIVLIAKLPSMHRVRLFGINKIVD